MSFQDHFSTKARVYAKAHGADPVDALQPGLARIWGDGRRSVVWPLGGRLGRVGS